MPTITDRLVPAHSRVIGIDAAMWLLRTEGHSVTTEPGPDCTISVYVNGQHAWDCEMGQQYIATALLRSVLNDHEEG